jgi:hypothetical protein
MGLNLSSHQTTNTVEKLGHELYNIPSSTVATWGSLLTFDVKIREILVHNLSILLNLGSLTGLTGGSSPRLVPSYKMIERVEILINNVLVQNGNGDEQFINTQTFSSNEDRTLINNGAGAYGSVTQRAAKSAVSSDWIINLKTLFDQCDIALLTEAHTVQVRVMLAPMANVIVQSGATGTGSVVINSSSLLVKATRIPSDLAQHRVLSMKSVPEHYLYHALINGSFNVQSGVSQSNITLSPINGKVALFYFVVRPVISSSTDDSTKYTKIKSFSINNSAGSNITSGQQISSEMSLSYLSPYWTTSSYLSETATGASLTGAIVDNGANVYMWSFSSNPVRAMHTGARLSSQVFTGSETLTINWTSALTQAYTVDVFCMREQYVALSSFKVDKFDL